MSTSTRISRVYDVVVVTSAPERVILISCVATKRDFETCAKDLFISRWFERAKAYAAKQGVRWFVISAELGLLEPHELAYPYNHTVRDKTPAERVAWGKNVAAQIERVVERGSVVEILAGEHYRKALIPFLAEYTVTVPMQGKGIGQQVQWLTQQVAA